MNFMLQITPVGKPTMTAADKYLQRPCVLKYRAFCDRLRYKAWGKNQKQKLLKPTALIVNCYFQTALKGLHGHPHEKKPDASNILKAVEDALFVNDEMIFHSVCKKMWTGQKDYITVGWEIST